MNNNISLQSLVTFVLFPIQLAICLGAIESSAASDPCVIDVPFAGGTPTLNDSRTIFPSHAHDPGNAFAPIVYTHKAIERAGGPIRRISTIFWPLLAEGVGFGKPYEVKSRFAFPDKIHLGSAVMEQYGATDGYGKIAVVGRNWGEPSASTGKSDSSQKPSASIWLSEAGEKFQILPYFKGANEVPDRIKWSQKHESFLVTTTRLSKKRLATGSPDRPRYLLTDRKIEPFQEKELSPSLEIKQGVIGIWRGWLIFRGSDGMNHVLDHGMSQEGRLRIFPTIDANWYFFEGSEWDIALRLDFSAAIPNVAEKVYFFDHRGWFESIVGYIFGTRDDLRRRYGADNVRFYPSPGLGGCIGYSQAMKRVSRCDGHIFEQGQFVDRTAQFGNSKYWYLDDATAVNIPKFRTDSGKLLYYKNDKFHALEYSSFANAVNIQNLPRSNKSFIVSNNSISEIRMDSDRLSLTEISGKKIKSEGTNKGTWWHAKILQIPESKQLIIFGHDSLHLLNGAKSRIGWKPANGSIDLTSHIAPIEIGKWRGIMFALRNHNQEVIALKLVTLERRYCSS